MRMMSQSSRVMDISYNVIGDLKTQCGKGTRFSIAIADAGISISPNIYSS